MNAKFIIRNASYTDRATPICTLVHIPCDMDNEEIEKIENKTTWLLNKTTNEQKNIKNKVRL